ncbi:hypothetical protein FP2506_05291 [Fulvimarina pelagi HTCC2506]|uniref:Uncharacterized protein n=1 Tax=Fulvimarina pelagi HTCC2506 TaxID=314231 RepID=Q0G7Y8_9HYPH|nr:hypothetical protein [Fulvimarina pelagi]EAU42226.1 hypothetical protein FP2506_05291 [Fulvimarina pelagi HTCC2506]
MSAQHSENAIREQSCPIALDLLAHLIRTEGEVREELIREIPGEKRAALGFFCYSRVHLRSLAFDVVLQCEMKDLRQYAGAKGDLLRQQALDFRKEAGSKSIGSRRITLARRAVA